MAAQSTPSQLCIRAFLEANPSLIDTTTIPISRSMQDLLSRAAAAGLPTHLTNAELTSQIAATQAHILSSNPDLPDLKHSPASPTVPDLHSPMGRAHLARTIDHTLLKLDASESQIDALCAEARAHSFKSVCVRLPFVRRCVEQLRGTDVLVACVVGFHEGTQSTGEKVVEARAAVKEGAAELDVVIDYEALKRASSSSSSSLSSSSSASCPLVNEEGKGSETPSCIPLLHQLLALRALCPADTVTLKLILETSQLSPAQIVAGTHLAHLAAFDLVKTSTGFNGRGASLEDVRLMGAVAAYLGEKETGKGNEKGRAMQVKASGGIRDLESARRMLEAGAGRLGCSAGVVIMKEAAEGRLEGGRKVESGGGGEY